MNFHKNLEYCIEHIYFIHVNPHGYSIAQYDFYTICKHGSYNSKNYFL